MPTSGLAFKPAFCTSWTSRKEIIRGQSDEAAGDLDDVEAQLFALSDVEVNRFRSSTQHVFDEAASGNQDRVGVADVEELPDDALWHQRERTAGELQRVHVGTHRLQDILKVARTHRRVIGPTDLGNSSRARLRRSLVEPQEGEGTLLSACR